MGLPHCKSRESHAPAVVAGGADGGTYDVAACPDLERCLKGSKRPTGGGVGFLRYPVKSSCSRGQSCFEVDCIVRTMHCLGFVYGVSTMTHVRLDLMREGGGEGERGGEGEERSHMGCLSRNIVYNERLYNKDRPSRTRVGWYHIPILLIWAFCLGSPLESL